MRYLAKCRNVMETMRLEVQFVVVARELPILRAQLGKISAFTVHGTGPIPGENETMYTHRATSVNHEKLLGQY